MCRQFPSRDPAPHPEREYEWEDYIEHDGVDPPRLHPLKMTMTKREDKIVLDLAWLALLRQRDPSTGPGITARAVSSIKWVAVALRNLAETPERMAEMEINEGICDVIDIIFPEEPTIVSPQFPGCHQCPFVHHPAAHRTVRRCACPCR